MAESATATTDPPAQPGAGPDAPAQSAPETPAPIERFRFEDAFPDVPADDPEASNGERAESPAPATSDQPSQATADESADVNETDTPGSDGADDDKLPRRGAAELRTLKQTLDELRAEVAGLRRGAPQPAPEPDPVAVEYATAYGPDDEFVQLSERNNLGEALTHDEYQKLSQWTQNRRFSRPIQGQRDLAWNQHLASEADAARADAKRQYGVDVDFSSLQGQQNVSWRNFFGLFAASVAAAKGAEIEALKTSHTTELAERDRRIADLETALKGRRVGEFAAHPQPERAGGGSGEAGALDFDPSRDWRTNLDAALSGPSRARRR